MFVRILNLLMGCAVVAAWALTALNPNLPGERDYYSPQPVNVPAWESSDRATGCKPKVWDGFQNVLVVTQGNDRVIIPFNTAWKQIQDDEPANDIWVIGYCP